MVLQMMAIAGYLFFSAALINLISQIEEGPGTLTYLAVMANLGGACLLFYPALLWMTVTFRPERDAELIYLLNDSAWLQSIGGLFLTWPLWIVLAIAAFAEKGETRYFSRWYGYLCAWTAVLFLPSQLIFFLQTGPFAWNGLFSFYVPFTVLGAWVFTTIYYVMRAGRRGANAISSAD